MRVDEALRALRMVHDITDDPNDDLPDKIDIPGGVDNGPPVDWDDDDDEDPDDDDDEDWEPDEDPYDQTFGRPWGVDLDPEGLPQVELPAPDLSDTFGDEDDDDDDQDDDDDVGGGGWNQGPGDSFDPKTAGGRGYCPQCGETHDGPDPDDGDCPVEVRKNRPTPGQWEYRPYRPAPDTWSNR